jgi:hypothetical protein
MELEQGAAGVVIQLSDSGINVSHIEDGTILRSYPQVSLGTWELMFDTMTKLLEERTTDAND